MHIPDGYLGPATCGFFYAVMLPVWAWCSHHVKKTLKAKQVPYLAIGAAFSFVVMLVDFPLPGGTPAHATGAGLLAILLGPAEACIAITVTIVLQALLGDGGITSIGANSFNMAFVSVFASFYLYKLVAYKAAKNSNRRVFAAGIASYIGITLAAFLTGVEVGLQKGYSPYGVKTASLVLSVSHLFLFGLIEAALTVLVVKFLQRQERLLENSRFY